MLTKLSKQLSDFGLSKNEIAVYIALLSQGSDTASNIAEKAKLNRSTTYVQLDSLMSYGLASTFKKGKKTYFSPESPRNVKRLIDSKIKELEKERDNIEELIPELNELYSELGEAPDIKTFEGKQGLKTMREAVINSGASEFYVLYNADQLYRIFSESELEDFSRKRAKADIKSHALYNKSGKSFTKKFGTQKLVHLSEKEYKFDADIYVYGDKVSLAATSGKVIGLTIQNKQIADSIRSLFQLAFKADVKKIDER